MSQLIKLVALCSTGRCSGRKSPDRCAETERSLAYVLGLVDMGQGGTVPEVLKTTVVRSRGYLDGCGLQAGLLSETVMA